MGYENLKWNEASVMVCIHSTLMFSTLKRFDRSLNPLTEARFHSPSMLYAILRAVRIILGNEGHPSRRKFTDCQSPWRSTSLARVAVFLVPIIRPELSSLTSQCYLGT